MKLKLILIFLLFSFFSNGQNVVINEIMASNSKSQKDIIGNNSDWIELYNASSDAIDLEGYCITDDENIDKYIFSKTIINPKGFLLIFASGLDTVIKNEIHTNFKISQSGETLVLSDPFGVKISEVESKNIQTNTSYGCQVDGGSSYQIFTNPTPNSKNITELVSVQSSHSSGFYKNTFDLKLSVSNPNYNIYYTLNGNKPTEQDHFYSQAIQISPNQKKPLRYSVIPTTPLEGQHQLYEYIWKEPKQVYQSTVVRYAAFYECEMVSKVNTHHYFVDKKIKTKYSLPVVSISTDSTNLFDYEKGIYIPGKRFDEKGFNWFPEGNYHHRGKDWEREIHMAFFDKKGHLGFEANAGIRMRGYGSTANPQKSFNTYFRKKYGTKKINYPIFDDSKTNKYKRLIFRNGGNDFLFSHFKDALLQDVVSVMNLDLQKSQPAILFINGEYWGIHNIREKYDKYYLKNKYGVDEKNINILGICDILKEGDNASYKDLVIYINDNDLSCDAEYEYVKTQVDIDNFIDFIITEIYYANYDWPCNNYKKWKTNDPDSKWRYLIYDLDYSFGYDHNTQFDKASMFHSTKVGNGWPNCGCSNLMFRKLLFNEDFKQLFIEKFEYSLEHVFNPERIIRFINSYQKQYRPEIQEHINRWNYPENISKWNDEIIQLKEFARARPCFMKGDLNLFFDINDEEFNCEEIPNFTLIKSKNLYPDPERGMFIFNNTHKREIQYATFEIFDHSKYRVYIEKNISIKVNETKVFNFDFLPKGEYFFKIKSNGFIKINQFTID